MRDPSHRPQTIAALVAFRQVSIPDLAWDSIGDLHALLRAAGLPTPWADAVISALAVQLTVELWARDQHFLTIQSLLPQLRLFVEPP
jgi:predicted nucleic acid-binding protein